MYDERLAFINKLRNDLIKEEVRDQVFPVNKNSDVKVRYLKHNTLIHSIIKLNKQVIDCKNNEVPEYIFKGKTSSQWLFILRAEVQIRGLN